MENLKVLSNGVEVFKVEVGNDFVEAQNILDLASATEDIDAEYAYNYRVDFDGVGTYKVKVERKEEYERFIGMIKKEQNHLEEEKRREKGLIMNLDSSFEGIIKKLDEIDAKYGFCDCKVCQFEPLTFEEWKNGKMESGAKVGKTLRKAGFEQSIIDFYSAQVKTERDVFLSILDEVQYIAGMSNYAKIRSWDGYNGTSCMDTRHDMNYCYQLGGALHDNKLFVAMLHDSLDDLEDMQDKLKARVLMRYVTIDDIPCLIPSTYYGNNDTKSELDYCLKKLSEVNIFSRDVRIGGTEYHREEANGFFQMVVHDELYFCETFEDSVEVECPMCDGHGNVTRYIGENDHEVEVECPACSGSGEIYASYYIEVDEYVDVEVERSIEPYCDDYSHNGRYVSIEVDKDRIRIERVKNGITLV